jgi:molecular chaperone GrpE
MNEEDKKEEPVETEEPAGGLDQAEAVADETGQKNGEGGEPFKDKYLRALADYQNLLKQTAKDREDFVKYALDDFLQNILPIYDHLKMSMSGLSEEESKNAWAIGVRHVLKQFKDVLAQHGIEEIKTVGAEFDHNTMEAVDGSGETVKQELMPGYKLNGKVIRPAKVIVAPGAAASSPSDGEVASADPAFKDENKEEK